MKRKTLFLIAGILTAGILAFMFRSAQFANKQSKDIMEDFKRVDNSLKRTNDSLTNSFDSSTLNAPH